MRVLYYDCFCGISGDMNLAALIDLGVPREYLIKEISKLGLDSEYEIKFETSAKKGITGTRVDVILKNEHTHHEHLEEQHNHSHIHEHGHTHDHNHEHINKIAHEHQHRNLKDIEEIINSSTLDNNIKKMSIEMFMKVAVAEAKVHGKSLDEVHFHEVGATDSIVDIVGAAIAIDYLKVDKIMASTVQVGGGFVKCAHGLMPVPAPATAEILKNIPMNTGIVQFETTTPTGAAILAANVKEFTDKIDFSVEKIGYGIGHRDLDIPNILRVYLGVKEESEEIQEQYIIETNIDDMNPELYGYIEEKLFEKGALDVYKTPIFMKKGRPAIKLSILVNNNCEKEVLDVIFKESTSIGVRKYKVEKIMLNREFSKVKTKYGEVTIKKSFYKGELVKYKAEYEDCRNIAIENNIPIEKVYKEVNKMLQENGNE
ncbi:nickel pincer cofactor biosynthesis protein LarC [Clostridium sp. YIM B02551]|uniref:nickel pincer cofactor biosynthesis protein LarC n=1 Tax=Clostridium sp. YIM B02551 TaxID=2910679 RepID=UPI001EEBDA14|nr:nickel pincer cofactor biosynthesis protein LarC [Clostridium sp. YIM B02551]